VFLARLPVLDGSHIVETGSNSGVPDENNAFVWQQKQVNERMTPESSETYRARGVVWNPNERVLLQQVSPGVAPSNVLIDGYDSLGNYNPANDTRAYDPATGITSYDTRLGGKAYLDPNLGTVHFSGASPAKNSELYLTYQPRFIRVNSSATSGYADATGLWDGRLVSDPYELQLSPTVFASSSWHHQDGTVALQGDSNAELARYTNDRLIFTYTRGGSSATQGAGPQVATFRLGVRLNYKVQTQANGLPVKLIVTGNNGPYQVDAAQGRVYFTAVDEDRPVQITYWGVDDNGNPVVIGTRDLVAEANVTWVGERSETPIPIEQAVNEANLSAFLDPFQYLDQNMRRPPLVWLFWNSTRTGQPDLYFESIAPAWSPIVVGK
jgi:hypothetical protein